MKMILRIVVIFVIAGVVPAILPSLFFWAITGSIGSALIPLGITFGHILFLGLPAFFLGLYFKAIRWWSSISVSFVVGALPTAIYLWPLRHPMLQSTWSRWDNGKIVQTMIHGVPTATGWSDYIGSFTIMGLFGIVGGIAFWLVWESWIQRDTSWGD